MFKNSIYYLMVFFFAFAIIGGCGKEAPKQKTEEKKADTVKQQTTQTKQDTVKDVKKDGDKSGGNVMVIESTLGTIKVKLFPDKAPKTVEHIEDLVNKGFYNGVIFHRVIDGFMIQGGDPTGTGSGGSGKTIPDEFNNGLKHKKGVIAMGNTGRPNSQDSQFYITLAPQPSLDGKYTIFGEVISGMDAVEKIGKTKTGPNDRPVTEVKMKKVYMEKE